MARPQKNSVDYFPHDAGASDSDTLTILQGRWGNDGYAFWFRLLEKLAGSDGHFIDCRNPVKWQLLLAKTQLSAEIGEEIMATLTELEAIDGELWKHRVIWCENLVKNIASVYVNRKKELPARPVITGSNPITTNNNPITTTDNTQSRVNDSKENYSKRDNNDGYLNEDFKAYMTLLANRYPALNIENCWQDCNTWYKDHNKVMKDAKGALRNWCNKELDINPRRKPAGKQAELPTTEELKKEFNQNE